MAVAGVKASGAGSFTESMTMSQDAGGRLPFGVQSMVTPLVVGLEVVTFVGGKHCGFWQSTVPLYMVTFCSNSPGPKVNRICPNELITDTPTSPTKLPPEFQKSSNGPSHIGTETWMGPSPSVNVGPSTAIIDPSWITFMVFPFHPSPKESVNSKI